MRFKKQVLMEVAVGLFSFAMILVLLAMTTVLTEEMLLEESGVLLLPSTIYRSELGPTPNDRFRLGYGRKGLDEGLAALEAHVRQNIQ